MFKYLGFSGDNSLISKGIRLLSYPVAGVSLKEELNVTHTFLVLSTTQLPKDKVNWVSWFESTLVYESTTSQSDGEGNGVYICSGAEWLRGNFPFGSKRNFKAILLPCPYINEQGLRVLKSRVGVGYDFTLILAMAFFVLSSARLRNKLWGALNSRRLICSELIQEVLFHSTGLPVFDGIALSPVQLYCLCLGLLQDQENYLWVSRANNTWGKGTTDLNLKVRSKIQPVEWDNE